MEVMEAYHAISKYLWFYDPYPEPAFQEVRKVLRAVRSELQRELTKAIIRTDFNDYLQ